MSTVLITTTVHVPNVLRLFREYDPNVEFIVAGDKKTPHDEVAEMADDIGKMTYLSPEEQRDLGYECSEVIGWNSIQRRNIALLEAIKRKPDVIVTVDDDNIPVDEWYFSDFEIQLANKYSGVAIRNRHPDPMFFNVGSLFSPPFYHRGVYPELTGGCHAGFSVRDNVGVVAGLWYGDPDINAAERAYNDKLVTSIPDVLRSGLAVDRDVFAPFNSQNTAYKADLAPLMAVLPGVGRHDDIWGSYMAQRVMRETGHVLVYGPPFTWQERNKQDVIRNIRDEIYGMRHTLRFVHDLSYTPLISGSVVEMLDNLWSMVYDLDYIPNQTKGFGKAWIRDLGSIL